MKYPPQDYLKSIFTYCKETGILTRKARPREHFSCDRTFNIYNSKYAGTVVSAKNEHGYLIAIINKVHYRAHRVAWIIEHGRIDDGLVIDHVNGIVDDNRLSNLRLCTHTENLRNMKSKSGNLPVGVYFDKHRNSYRASIGAGTSGRHITKRFRTALEAASWRESMEKSLGYHYLHGKKKGL